LVEGSNNRIKVINRMAYGYRDDAYFFLKLRAAFPGVGTCTFFLPAMSRGNHQKRSGPVSGAASFNSLRSTGRSEALLVLHVHEAADVETAVVRVAGVRLVVVRACVLLEDVVGTQRDGGVPRGVPADLDVVERGRAQFVHRNDGALSVRCSVVRQAATNSPGFDVRCSRLECTLLLHTGVIARAPAGTEIA